MVNVCLFVEPMKSLSSWRTRGFSQGAAAAEGRGTEDFSAETSTQQSEIYRQQEGEGRQTAQKVTK